MESRLIKVTDVVYREDLYPRIKHDASFDELVSITLRFLNTLNLDANLISNIMPIHPSLKDNKYRRYVIEFFDNKCFVCGYKPFVDVHHVKHKAKTGTDRIDNLIVLCPNHHKEWHYIENTFFLGVGGISEANIRASKAIDMDWPIPDFVMRNNVAPFLIQLSKKAEL